MVDGLNGIPGRYLVAHKDFFSSTGPAWWMWCSGALVFLVKLVLTGGTVVTDHLWFIEPDLGTVCVPLFVFNYFTLQLVIFQFGLKVKYFWSISALLVENKELWPIQLG